MEVIDSVACTTICLEVSEDISYCEHFNPCDLDTQNVDSKTFLGPDNEGVRRTIVRFLADQPEYVTFRSPASAWDHIKGTWLKWLVTIGLLNSPRMNVETVEVKNVFPFNKIQYPKELGPVVRIARRLN